MVTLKKKITRLVEFREAKLVVEIDAETKVLRMWTKRCRRKYSAPLMAIFELLVRDAKR